MNCPHCSVEFYLESDIERLGADSVSNRFISKQVCPNPKCGKIILYLITGGYVQHQGQYFAQGNSELLFSKDSKIELIFPRKMSRKPAPPEVPSEYANDFNEASVILNDILL